MTYKKQVGNVVIPGGMTLPEPHEIGVALIIAKLGNDVTFIQPSRTKGAKTPDVEINGLSWEIKSPIGNGKKTVQKQLRRASVQSKNIVFDAQRTKLNDQYIEKELQRQFKLYKSLRKVMLIKKDESILVLKR